MWFEIWSVMIQYLIKIRKNNKSGNILEGKGDEHIGFFSQLHLNHSLDKGVPSFLLKNLSKTVFTTLDFVFESIPFHEFAIFKSSSPEF